MLMNKMRVARIRRAISTLHLMKEKPMRLNPRVFFLVRRGAWCVFAVGLIWARAVIYPGGVMITMIMPLPWILLATKYEFNNAYK